MHLVLKCCRIAFNQQGRVFRDRIEQRREPGLVGLGEITEDMGMNQSLVTRMANPQTHPRIMRADMGGDRADAVVARRPAAMTRELRARLEDSQKTGRPLKIYCGYDPRTSDLHLGHTLTMRKLRQFQELGHEVTFLIGNYTSLLGDPSDKDKLRPQLTSEEVAHNARTYSEQAFKILDRERTRVRFNAEWLSELSFIDVIRLAQNFTVQQFLGRENFAQRLQKGDPIYLHETFYALMQGYDAVAQETDVQVGGTDQLFNILTAGRKLQDAAGQKPQIFWFVNQSCNLTADFMPMG